MKTHTIKNLQVSNPTADNICPSCEKTFKTKKTLKAHIKTVHERKNVFFCVECGENFSRSDYLDAHMRGHKGEKPFSSEQCQKYFRHKQTFVKVIAFNVYKGNRIEAVFCIKDSLIFTSVFRCF